MRLDLLVKLKYESSNIILFVGIISGGARGHPDRGSSFPDRGAEVSAGITLPCNPPPTSSHYI